MERRDVFRILAAGAAMPVLQAAPYEPRFFSKSEYVRWTASVKQSSRRMKKAGARMRQVSPNTSIPTFSTP